MFTAEAGRDRALFEWIVQRFLRRKEVAHRETEGLHELDQEERFHTLGDVHLVISASFHRVEQPAGDQTGSREQNEIDDGGRPQEIGRAPTSVVGTGHRDTSGQRANFDVSERSDSAADQ
jgi:hypothetical protein